MLAAELVRFNVDIIVTAGSGATVPAKAATVTIPIVMTQEDDPVVNGFVASLARPAGNITGLSKLSLEISGKRLDILKEIAPKLSRVAVFGTSTTAANARSLEEIKLAAASINVQLQYQDVLNSRDIDTAFRAAVKGRSGPHDDGRVGCRPHRFQIVELAVKSRLPAIYEVREWVEDGGRVSYGVNLSDLNRRAATYVDKI